MPIEPEWFTIKQVTEYAGCARTSVYVSLRSGALEGRRVFGRTLVSRASINELFANSPRFGTTAEGQ